MRLAIPLFAGVAAIVTATWWWLGHPVDMPPSPLGADGKLACVSYAPFRGAQNPLESGTHIPASQIEEDLARLKAITGCIRTYSTEHGLDQIPEIAKRHRLKVMLGVWLSSHPDRSRARIEETVALASRFPDVVSAVIVGNEVLLRGEMSSTALATYIREVKSRVAVPVTYADVWEFWLRHADLAAITDFVTVHILPYWEDVPIPADTAASHVDSIRRQVAARFPGKEVLIGEVGWPSAGRMREGALPSPSAQALVLHEVLAAARRGDYRVNLIEAFDQPWKRRLEGTVGGHWGLFSTGEAEPKFRWGAPVSDHPRWLWQALGGIAFAGLVFGAALATRQGRVARAGIPAWTGIAVMAAAGGVLLGLIAEKTLVESLGAAGLVRNLALAALLAAAPVGAMALAAGVAAPPFSALLGPRAQRPKSRLALAMGALLVLTTVMALQSALALVFDPRYRDFPYPQVSVAAIAFLALTAAGHGPVGRRGTAERAAAIVLGLCAVFVMLNEGLANWQAAWFSTACLVLAATLAWGRGAQGS